MGLQVSSLVPTRLLDSAALVDMGSYAISSALARLVFDTYATTLKVQIYSDMKSLFSGISKIGIYIDGVYFNSLNPAADGNASFYVGMDKGAKRIELVAGPETNPSGTVRGNYVLSVVADQPMTQVLTEDAPNVLVYGDSITVGDGAGTSVQSGAWVPLLRQSYSGSVACEAWGYRSLYSDASTPELRAVFVSGVADRSPAIVWLAIGTNDYGLALWNAANFGTAYAATLDDLHAAMPDIPIYAQSPIVRTSSGANALGSTLADYRSAIVTACTGRDWATYVDGVPFMTTADLADGIHPNLTGHGLYEDAVLAVLT